MMEEETFKIKKGAHEDDESFKSTAKRRQFGYDAKRSDEPYKEARKYLASRIGDKWNDVWADICSPNTSKDKVRLFSYIQEQVNREWSHLVYLTCFSKEDGGIYTIANRVGEIRVDKEINYGWKFSRKQLYVYEGILRATLEEKVVRPKETKVIQFNGQEFAQKDDVWYRVILKPITYGASNYHNYFYDTLRKRSFSCSDGYRFYGREAYCYAHYPLKNKELKALKDFLCKQENK